MGALSTVIPGNMVKSRSASKAPCLAAPSQSPPPTHAGLEPSLTSVMPSEISALQCPLPPNRNPNFQNVKDELGTLTRLGSVLYYSDEQSSMDGEEEDSQPATSLISSPSPGPAHTSTQLQASAFLSATDHAADLKATLSTSASSGHAVLAFQRWRISSLKALFSQELKNVLNEAQQDEARFLALEEEMEKKEKHLVHALADSAQLRAQLCALENVKGQPQSSSEVEILQVDLVRALERATSSEAEVERYNKEIKKLRERLKSMEDEASRLDSELKANVSSLQKEKDGIAKENQVLLEQLARKDKEVLTQTEEVRNLKSVLACLRISRLELERLKNAFQGNAAQQMKFALENTALQNLMERDCNTTKASFVEIHGKVKEESLPSSLVFSQVLDLLQKVTACLQKNEAYVDFSEAKLSGEERGVVRPNSPQNVGRGADRAADCKLILCPGQTSSSHQLVNDGHSKEFRPSSSPVSSTKLSKLFVVTCWKWRWIAAASEVQALYKRLNTLESIGKMNLQQTFTASFHESLRSCLFQEGVHPSVDAQAPLTLEKVFSLFTSIWNLSSQSAQHEKEAFLKNRQIEHLLEVMKRWMQKALKKRQLERVIAHWLRFLLQSWKNKFRHHNVDVLLGMAPTPDTKLPVSKPTASHFDQSSRHNQPKHMVDNAVHIKRSTNSTNKARMSELRTRFVKKERQKPKTDAGIFQEEDQKTFQEWLHHRLVDLEASIVRETKSWQQEHLGDKLCAHKSSAYSAATNLVWRICCKLEHFIFEVRNQMMSFLGVWTKSPPCLHAETGALKPNGAGPSKLLNFKIGSTIAKC